MDKQPSGAIKTDEYGNPTGLVWFDPPQTYGLVKERPRRLIHPAFWPILLLSALVTGYIISLLCIYL
jgi:hypothetical protein